MKSTRLRHRLFIVVAAAVLPLAAMSGLALYAGYQQQRHQAERSGLDIARAFSTAIDAELSRTTSVLQVLADSVLLDRADLTGFHARAHAARQAQTGWRAVVLSDLEGKVILNSEVAYGDPVMPIVERESLAQVVRTSAPAVGFLAKGQNGRWAFPVRVPVMQDGKARYVLSAVIDPEAILTLLQKQRVPGDWVVAVADSKGLRVARTRSMLETLGTPFSPTLVQMMDRGGAEGTGITHNSEGDAVFTAYTRASETGWVTAVGLPTTRVDASGRRSFMALGAGILLSIVVGLLAAFYMARSIASPMDRLRAAAIALGRGERIPPPSTDIREIKDVGASLVTASDELDRARVEREELLRSEQAARATAESANRAKDEFLAMLGHELRNPVGAISNAASLLDNPRIGPEQAVRARGVITRQVSHLARLMDDLLDAGRAVMGKIVLRPQPLDLAAVAMQSLATLKATGRLGGHRVEQELKAAWVSADPIRLDQVIGNLVVNAVKYTPEGGLIRVSVGREGGEAVLRVTDNGIGIEPSLAARVFDLFVQGDRLLDRSQGGLGIGLTLVRRLSELHGGIAEVSSAGTGRGSEFTVRLPAIEPAAQANAVRADVKANARHILVIEDSPDARDMLRMLLDIQGHTVETASDGATGVEKALALQPQIALVDVGLPHMDGYEVARRIRAHPGLRQPYLVALTGYGTPEDRQRALDAGFDAHVAKPVDNETLASLLSRAQTSRPP